MSAGVATRSRMPFSISSTTASVRAFPHAFISFGQVQYGCRVASEEAAKVSRRGGGGFCFTPLSPSCRIRGRNSSANQKRSQGRRVRDRPLSEKNNRTGEDAGDNQTTVQGAQTSSTAAEDRLRFGVGGVLRSQGSGSSTDASIAEVEGTDGNGASSGVSVEGGKGLQGTLGVHSKKFFGIRNGIALDVWDPVTETRIDYQYSADDVEGKYVNKQKLRERLGLGSQGDDARRPLVGCVTRLVPQKGVHLIKHSIYRTLERGGQYILSGSSPVPQIQSSGALDTVVTKQCRDEDCIKTRTTSGRSASTSGVTGSWRFKKNRSGVEIERLEVLARRDTSAQTLVPRRQAQCKPSLTIRPKKCPGIRSSVGAEESSSQSRFKCRSLSDASSSTTSVIEQLIDDAAASDCAIGLNATIDAVDYFSASTSLSDQVNLSTNLDNVSPLEESSVPSAFNPEFIFEAQKKTSMVKIQKQLSSLTGRKGTGERGSCEVIVRGDLIQLPDNIDDVLPVNPTKDPAEYLLLYSKLLGAGRLQECVAILESIDEHSILNMNKVNPHEFYSACKRRRALQEAFRFSRLIGRKSLRNYNMLLSVCAQAQDASAACRVHEMVRNAGLKADCIFYTTLISACAKAGRIDLMFKFLNEMETQGIDSNVQTFGAMIDGCARAGDVPKAFGIYKKMLNQNVKPDRVIFNTLIAACGRAGALVRAFEVLADMRDELDPVALDHFTYGSLIAACARAGEVERAIEVYKRMRSSKVVGTAECYTAAVHACSQKGYLKSALSIYEDMKKDGVRPDEVFFCALIDVAGHAGKLDTAFAILEKMKSTGINPGPSTYNTLMVVCGNVGDAESAMQVYEEIKVLGLNPTVSTLNALVAALCAGRELDCALTVLQEFRIAGVMPNTDTYSILLAACEREDEVSIALKLYNHSKDDSVKPTLKMFENILDLCTRRIESEYPPPHNPRLLNINKNDAVALHQYWENQGLVVYDDLISAGLIPTLGIISQVLGCLRVSAESSQHILYEERSSNSFRSSEIPTTISVEDACGIYLPQALTIYEDATTLGLTRNVNYAAVPTSVDMRNVPVYAGEVGVLALLKGLKHRHDEGLHLNSVKLIFAVEVKEIFTARGGFKRVHVSSRTGEAVMSLLRRLRIKYEGHESVGEVIITTSAIRTWLKGTRVLLKKQERCRQGSRSPKQRLSQYSLRAV